jgi:putative Holliday junction resolvase
VGLAISDPGRRVAVPLETVAADEAERAIAEAVAERGVTLVVVGHALSMSGRAGERAVASERMAEGLRTALDVEVVLHDERLSTAEAERNLRDAGAGRNARKAARDSSAAAIILQSWLDSRSS